MARPSKAQQYAILWLNSQNMTTQQIAEELSISEKQVQSAVEKHTPPAEPAIQTAKQPVGTRSQNLMIRQTSGKKTNTVAIMTGEASMLNDSLKDKSQQQRNTDKYIFRPNK